MSNIRDSFVSVVGFAHAKIQKLKAENKDLKSLLEKTDEIYGRLVSQYSEVTSKLAEEREYVEKLQRELADALDRNRAASANATGDSVMVRKDGFSRPFNADIGVCDEVFHESSFGDEVFVSRGQRDGFGRRIFEQVS